MMIMKRKKAKNRRMATKIKDTEEIRQAAKAYAPKQ